MNTRKPLLSTFLATFTLTLGACQLTPEQTAVIAGTAAGVATSLDRDGSGHVTREEAQEGGGSIALWTSLITGALALLGGSGAVMASGKASKAQKDVDDLYDRQLSKAA